ncbi:MAG: HAD-IIA family hydrolase [Desulfobacteraceae bacterium]|nr:HAD-IIA family hydrolase [Desulfobacteraceae bacterium]
MILPSLTLWIEQHPSELDAVLLDIDGVMINDGRRLPGSQHLLEILRSNRLPYLFLTNDGNHSTEEKSERLSRAGLAIGPDQIVSCGHALKPLVEEKRYTGRTFFIMGDLGTPCYAEAAGLKATRTLSSLKQCTGVIIGEDNYPWEPVINAVVNFFIDRPDAPLIVPNPDEFYPGGALKIHIAAGGVARFIQQVLKAYGLALAPFYLGKPFAPIFQKAHQLLERTQGRSIPPERILMAGDNLAADIAGANQVGFRSALLLTGVTPADTLSKTDIQPEMIFTAL